MRIIVLHQSYGCDTGCCGHVVEVEDAPASFDRKTSTFDFGHPSPTGPNYTLTPDNIKEYVIDLVTRECGAEHVADIDWERCVVLDD